jgi:hypothetical protein
VQCDSINNGALSENHMKISAKGFLRIVGFVYVTLGTGGLAALSLPSTGLLYLCGLSAVFLLVTPPGLPLEYGIQAGCFEHPQACNLDADVIQHARTVIMALCVTSVVGGLSGIWATSTKEKQAGRGVWLVLVIVSLGIALWNLSVWLFDAHPSPFTVPTANTFWAVTYATAYCVWWQKDAE